LLCWWYSMTSAVCTTVVFSRRFSCHTRQRWFSARHTCSIVISVFFPPQPIRMFGDKSQHQQTQDLMPHQRDITAALKVAEANFGFADAKRMLDIPAAERDAQQDFHWCPGRGIR